MRPEGPHLAMAVDDLEVTRHYSLWRTAYAHWQPFEYADVLAANGCCKLLPPVKERGFSSNDIGLISACFTAYLGECYHQTLILHKESKCNSDLLDYIFQGRKVILL